MSKPNRAAATVHDFATSRIEKAAQQLDETRKQIAELVAEKDALSARILVMIRQDGEQGEDGKVRYETDQHRFQIIGGKNTYVDKKKMVTALSSTGLTPKQIKAIERACVKETEYEYPGVYNKNAAPIAPKVAGTRDKD